MQDANNIEEMQKLHKRRGINFMWTNPKRGDEKKPSLQGDFRPFKKHKRLAQWEPRFDIQAFIFLEL
jgi:hypothetical protein